MSGCGRFQPDRARGLEVTHPPIGSRSGADGAADRLLRRGIDLRPDAVRGLVWSWLHIFCVLSAYYMMRPIRDDMGVASGMETLLGAWSYALFSALGLSLTGIALAAVPLSAAWLLNGFWLGREQETMGAAQEPLSRMTV